MISVEESARKKNRYQKLKDQHLCVRCMKQDERTLSGKIYCEECNAKKYSAKKGFNYSEKATRPAQEEKPVQVIFQTATADLAEGTREWKSDVYRMLENFRKQNGPGCFKALEKHNTGLTADRIWTIYAREDRVSLQELRVLRWCLTGFDGPKPKAVGVLSKLPGGWRSIVADFNNGRITKERAVGMLHVTQTTFEKKIAAEWGGIR